MPPWVGVAVRTGARRVLAEPSALLMQVFFYLLVTGAVTSLWRVAVEANGGTVAGYDARALTWYLALSEGAYLAVHSRIIEEIGDDVAGGTVASEMLRPAPVVGVRLATELGKALPRLAVNCGAGVLLCLLTVGAPPSTAGLLLAVPAMLLAGACNLAAMHGVAALTFWLRDARTSWFLYQKLIFIFGGMLLPLQVLPPWLHDVAVRLPFMTMTYVPARLASGHVEPELLLVQLGWLAVLAAFATSAFAGGERRLQAVGG
ncbi:MAG TPA: ABC-2 family transporter protein [Acidimicrobiales bacterium]|nr:ABC-2 family transporter protein [Acidimicrobiales bacterium]